MAIFFVIAPIAFAPSGAPNPSTRALEAWLTGLAAVVIVIPILMLGGALKQKWLMVNGQIALARITRKNAMRFWYGWRGVRINRVDYEFTDASGNLIHCRGTDPTEQFGPGMTVAIYYDPANPKKQMAAFSPSYEVVLPGQ